MIQLTRGQTATLKHWFLPERPGPLIGLHVIHTGNSACFADRWPEPQVVLVETAGNYSLLGTAQAVTPDDLRPSIKGFVETSPAFVPVLAAAFPDMKTWRRVIFERPVAPVEVEVETRSVRRFGPADAYHLARLSPESVWISKMWGGPVGLASSGCGWGAFVAGQLVSVACTAFLGATYEDIGVVTEPGYRGLGLSVACAGALCVDMQARGHKASWSTSPDNVASVRVAEKLGFVLHRHDLLYVVGIPIPEPARPAAS